MQTALSKQGSGEESLKREAAEAEKAARAAEARADAADRRARALSSSLAAAKAQAPPTNIGSLVRLQVFSCGEE